MAAVGVGDPVRLVEDQEIAAHRRLLDRAAHDRGVGVDLLLAGRESDGAGRQLGGQPGVGLVRELAQRRGVDAAAVLLQREEGVVGLARVGRAEVEDDVLGARRAHGELGLGAVDPALLGEPLDAGRRAVVGRGSQRSRTTLRLRRRSRSGYCGGTLTGGNKPLVGGSRGGSARVAVPASADPTEGNSGNPPDMPGARGVRRHGPPPGPPRAAAPPRRGRGSATTSSTVRGGGGQRPGVGPVGHGHRAAHRVVLAGVGRPERGADGQHAGRPRRPSPASSGGRRSAGRGRRARRPRCGPRCAGPGAAATGRRLDDDHADPQRGEEAGRAADLQGLPAADRAGGRQGRSGPGAGEGRRVAQPAALLGGRVDALGRGPAGRGDDGCAGCGSCHGRQRRGPG